MTRVTTALKARHGSRIIMNGFSVGPGQGAARRTTGGVKLLPTSGLVYLKTLFS